MLVGDTKELEAPYFANCVANEFEDLHLELSSEIQDLLDELVPSTSETSNHSSNKGETEEMNLLRITIPKFFGKYEEWVSFRDLFKTLVHEKKGLSNVQKLQYLKCSMGGEAESLLRHISVAEVNYDIAWNILCERYDNPQMLLNAQLRKLLQLNNANESASSLKNLIDRTVEVKYLVESMDVRDLWESVLVFLTAQRFPHDTRQLWEQQVANAPKLVSFEEIKIFTEKRFRALEATGRERPRTTAANINVQTHQATASATAMCEHCNGGHSIRACDDLRQREYEERLRVVKRRGLCLNCLGSGHIASQCSSARRCNKCNRAHHTLLHKEFRPTTSNSMNNATGVHPLVAGQTREVLLATALVTIDSPNGRVSLRALLDQGSQTSLVTESAMQLLGIKRQANDTTVSGISSSARMRCKGAVVMELQTLGDERIEVNALILDQLTNYIPASILPIQKIGLPAGVRLADPHFYRPNKVDLLLGAEVYAEIILPEIKRLPSGPILQNTKEGWIVTGKMSLQSYKVEVEDGIDSTLRRFWELEEVPYQEATSEEEKRCESHYVENVRRQEDGRFVVRLPFKNEEAKRRLGHSRHLAESSFISLERRFKRDPAFEREYKKVIDEHIASGNMSLVHYSELKEKGNYLPHHAVCKESTTTKLRVVFDAARKTTTGLSLNDVLLTGPPIQGSLIRVLARFRMWKYAWVADIKKMFLQIRMNVDDAQYQRVVWRPSVDEVIKDYRFNTVTFGTTCASFLATRTLWQLAEEGMEAYPYAARMIKEDFYVDDLLSGDNELEVALAKRKEVSSLLESGGFELKKWRANDRRLLAGIPTEDLDMGGAFDLNLDEGFKSLGMKWHPLQDYFTYHLNLRERNTQDTKRTVLSDIATLFDPLGWIAPVIVQAKILMQSIWRDGCNWDAKLQPKIARQWKTLRNSLQEVTIIKIPRWIPMDKDGEIELHGFCDASLEAYAAVVYLLVRYSTKCVVRLLMAKTKVAPIKPVTIPRLELGGALLLAKMVKTVKDIYDLEYIKTWLWCDNTTVLCWLKGHPARWTVFVANRTSQIYDTVGNTPWRYVPTKENPADIASRGMMAKDLAINALWWNGPNWLESKPDLWPNMGSIEETEEEVRKGPRLQCLFVQNSDLDHMLEKSSSLTRLIRVTALCYKFQDLALRKAQERRLTTDDLKRALMFWVHRTQMKEFHKEIQRLQDGGSSKKGKLASLSPFIDAEGTLRVAGRLSKSCLSLDEQHPIIIPKFGRLTELILRQTHQATLHGHTQLMLSTIRKQYWILDARNVIKQFVYRCVSCFRARATTASQLMGSLPAPRVTISRPFTHTGVDYCGPFDIRDRNGRGCRVRKGYIAIFICLAVKAIHIELVSDMSTQAFLAALRRFIARRGFCSDIYSDNGTNFVGADKELKNIAASKEIMDDLSSKGIRWHFNPPAAPHFGGIWEAKSTKLHLRRILKQESLTFEEFSTLLTQIEACLNSRPLCPISDDATDDVPLTPGHFLVGDSLLAPPQQDVTEIKLNRLDRWQYVQRLSQIFWKRFTNEYLQQLQQRPKWVEKQPCPKVGDLCLVKDDRLPSFKWPLGRIMEVHAGTDGLVRVVSLRMNESIYKRPITKIALLPNQDSNEQ